MMILKVSVSVSVLTGHINCVQVPTATSSVVLTRLKFSEMSSD
jgi:hypothetical protein